MTDTDRMRAIERRALTEAPTVPPAEVRPTRYRVSCVPEGLESHPFEIIVEDRGNGRWAVTNRTRLLGADGTWSWGYQWRGGDEPITEAAMDEYQRGHEAWLKAHRFDLDTALELARKAAPLLTVNGFTVLDALAMQAQEDRR